MGLIVENGHKTSTQLFREKTDAARAARLTSEDAQIADPWKAAADFKALQIKGGIQKLAPGLAARTKPIALRPFQGNDRVRVLVNGQGCYCAVKDICSQDILTVLNYLNAERKMGRSTIGFGTTIHGNSIQIDRMY